MVAIEPRLKIIVADNFDARLTQIFPKALLHFHKNQPSLREVLYHTDTALLLLPLHIEGLPLFIQRLRKDRYLEVLPLVLYSEHEISEKECALASELGVNDFICLDDPKIEIIKNRVFSLASLYWKLKKENNQGRFEDLSRSVEFLDSLIEYLPNMIFVKDAKDLRFVRFNKAGEQLLGYKREDLIGKNDYDFFPKDQADHFTLKDRAVISSGHLLDIPEEPIHTKEGLRILHTKKIPLYDEKGNPSYLLGISEDITEIKKREQERLQFTKEQAARMEAEKGVQVRDEFLSVASHELKTPLTSLNLQFQIMKRWLNKKDFSESGVQRLLKIFEGSFYQLDRLASLIEDLLDISRIQGGRLACNFERQELSHIVKECVSRLHDRLVAANCELIWGRLDECNCDLDRFRIEQCIENLVSNAMKYGAGKPIEISLTKNPQSALLKVSDSGIGIDAGYQEKIFERFERAVSSRNYSGLGLGLFITKQIVEAHAGKIYVESELNKGSVFMVEIPLHRQQS